MRNFLKGMRRFNTSIGLVEQAQVVTSTAVVVSMVTIISSYFFLEQSIHLMVFISILTVGVIGYVSVIFSLRYGRKFEEQRRELLALNTIAEAVNHSVELNYVLQSAMIKVMELLHADHGWIYVIENQRLILRQQSGQLGKFFTVDMSLPEDPPRWLREPSILRATDPRIIQCTGEEFRASPVEIVASIPLERQGNLVGVLIIAGYRERRFEAKKIALLEAFGNQISVALQNASLFEQLKESERLYADLFEHSPDMYHSVDRNGTIVSCNFTETQILGLPKEEIIGRPVLRLYPQSQYETVRGNLKKIFEMGRELKGAEEQIQKHDGTLLDVSVNASIVFDGEGHPALARVVLRDITEKKKMEAKILQAQKIDSIGNLAGGIAHDFNNILTSILGSASLLKRKVNSDSQWIEKYIDLIETASRRGAALTRQLLTFARKNNPHVRLVDVNSVIDETLRLFEATTPKSIQIKTTLSPEPVIVEADEGQLQQTVLNLLLNARDAMPGGGTIAINCRAATIDEERARQFTEGRAGEYVILTVSDSGIGIPKHIINRIFEPFFTTKEQGKGTGLGLAVVYGVVRSHNGYINIESEVDSGSIFTIFLPRVVDGKMEKQVKKRKKEVVGGTEHILLVEDEISVGEIGVDILQDLGYSVEVARTGREAIEKLNLTEKCFDLVILDMNMPEMGGKATLEFIRKHFPAMKVLVCSGYSAMMIEDGKFMQAVDGFIQKPYELENLAGTIRSILTSSAE